MSEKEGVRNFAFFGGFQNKSNFTLAGKVYYGILKNFFARIFTFFWLYEKNGEENIPKNGPFLIVPNHQSFLDFLLIIFVFRKSMNLTFFIKNTYFDKFIWKHFLVKMGQIRADRRSIGKAISLLKDKKVPVVLFAEGTRTSSGGIGELNGGLTAIAKRIPNLKIIPVGINGAFEAWPAGQAIPRLGKKVKILVGEGFSFDEINGNEADFLAETRKRLIDLTTE